MSERTYSVPDISCGHCQSAIEGEVSGVAGVERVAVDITTRTVTVAGDATDAAVHAAIEAAGYEVADA